MKGSKTETAYVVVDDEPGGFGVVVLTPEMLRPDGPLVTAVRANSARANDAPTEREGRGWRGVLGGFCPVQGFGEVDGLSWYFRARHDRWSFEVWDAPFGNDGALPEVDPIWETEAGYGERHDASWMPFSKAWERIEASIDAFRRERGGDRT